MQVFDGTQSRLLEAAGHVFSEKGYRDATVREICLRAGARNIAAVNYYFRDKEHLYRAAIREAFRGRYQQLVLSEPLPEGLDAAQKLYLFVRNFIQHVVHDRSTPWQSQLLMRELAHPSESGGELVRQYIKPVYEVLWSTLRELVPEAPEAKLHLIAFSIIGQCVYHRMGVAVIDEVVGEEERLSYDVDCLAEHITQFSLSALGLDANQVR